MKSQKLLTIPAEISSTIKKQILNLSRATLGAAACCQEKTEQAVSKFIEKGTEVEKDIIAYTTSLFNKGYSQTKETLSDIENKTKDAFHDIEKSMDLSSLLPKLNFLNKSELEKLSAKVIELTKKLDSIQKVEEEVNKVEEEINKEENISS